MIDLHTHSSQSDGTFTPAELIEKAVNSGLKGIALTDHDTTSGLDKAISVSIDKNIIFIPGIEISVEFPYGEIHILGLGLKDWKGSIADSLSEIVKNRELRNRKIIKKIYDYGIEINYDEIIKNTGNVIGRPHFAAHLVKVKAAKSMQDAFNNFLGYNKPFYEPRVLLDPEQAISVIKEAGGKAVIAHPLTMHLSWNLIKSKLPEWKTLGIDGIEAYHNGTTANKCRRLEKIAENYGFIITGGSDFHGKNKPGIKLGKAAGGMEIPDKFLNSL